MIKITALLPAVAISLAAVFPAAAGTWYHPEEANAQQAQAQAVQQATSTGQLPAAGPVTCHMIWAAADKGKCLNEFPIAQGGRAPDATANMAQNPQSSSR